VYVGLVATCDVAQLIGGPHAAGDLLVIAPVPRGPAVAPREQVYGNAACTLVVLALADGRTVEIGVLAPVADAFARTLVAAP
jgi:hypothetical protein